MFHDSIENLLASIDIERMADSLWQLVCVPSPTCREKEGALKFASLLEESGAEVEIDWDIPESPNVIGRLKGTRPGPCIQLAGHVDHIDIPHPDPIREADRISGRGSADMKNGLAGILEIVRLLNETGCDFPGELLITVYGRHEAPDGDSKGLLNLLEKGCKGDAAIVFEGPDDAAAVMANGMCIWNIELKDIKGCRHETCEPDRTHSISTVIAEILLKIEEANQTFQNNTKVFELLPRESFFVGQVHCGDFYNRIPDRAFLQGTRRWQPNQDFDKIQQSVREMLDSIKLPESIEMNHHWIYVGDSYQVDENERIVQALVQAHERVTGQPCSIRGHSSVTDICRMVRNGNIPAVLCGFGTETGHADYEYARFDKMESACKVALATVLGYLESN